MRFRTFAAVLLAAPLFVSIRPVLGAEAELPQVFVDTTYVPPTGRTLAVPAGGDFQAALDAALPGDVIALEAGATFQGPFVLPNKSGSGWIIVRTSAPDSSLPPLGTRIDPSYAGVMPTLIAPPDGPAIATAPGAHHFRFIGVEIKPAAGTFGDTLIALGLQQPSEDTFPHSLIFDRCYVHGDAAVGARRGFVLNSKSSAVIDSYLADFKEVGAESQAILGWNGPGPFKIVNNYLEAAGVNLMFGGAGDPTIPDLVPSDIEIRRNAMAKRLEWRSDDPGYAGTPWTVKNLLTLKNARRVLIDGNLFEHNWPDGQNGTAILFTVRNQGGTAPWSTVEDVTFTNNIVRNTSAGIGLHGWDNLFPSQQTKRILIRNNLFDDISSARWGGSGRLFEANRAIESLAIDHNTGFQDGAILRTIGGMASISATGDARATVAFVGTGVTWVGFRGPQTGIARVSLDGVFLAEVDTFSATEAVQAAVFAATDLADAPHSLTIEVTGLRNPASLDAIVVVDAFDVSSSTSPIARNEETDPAITYEGLWDHDNVNRAWSGGGRNTNFAYRNNLTLHGDAGLVGAGAETGVQTLDTYFPNCEFAGNVLVGGNQSSYPADNFFPATTNQLGFVDLLNGDYRLAFSSAYKNAGTDGKDIGADIDAIEAAFAQDEFDPRPARFEDTNSSIVYTGDWFQGNTDRTWSGGTAALATAAGGGATFRFTGTSTSWIGFRGPQAGIARILLDGVFIADVDLFSANEEIRGVVYSADNLGDGSHSLTIEVTGMKNPASTESFVVVDAFDVPAPAVTRLQETDPAVTFTAGWSDDSASRTWSGGSAAFSTTAGEQGIFTFTGTSVNWLGFRGPQTGIARVVLDGVFMSEVDTFSETEQVQATLFTATGLADATHTLTIEITGLKNPASTDAFIVVDGFDVTHSN